MTKITAQLPGEVYELQPGGIYLLRYSPEVSPDRLDNLAKFLMEKYSIQLVGICAPVGTIEFLPPKD